MISALSQVEGEDDDNDHVGRVFVIRCFGIVLNGSA